MSPAELIFDPLAPIIDGDDTSDSEVLDRLKLNGQDVDAQIQELVTPDSYLELTLEGASTLVLAMEDPKRVLLASEILEDEAEMKLSEDAYFAQAGVHKASDSFEITFEDREVHWLRNYDSPLKVARGKFTRAEFIFRLLKEVREGVIGYYCPELHKPQPIAHVAHKASSKAQGKTTAKKDLSWTLQGKASLWNDEQTASGISARNHSGVSTFNTSRVKGWWVMESPNHHRTAQQQIDVGPDPKLQRAFDVSPMMAKEHGYPNGEHSFPTDQGTWKGYYVGKGDAAKKRAHELAGAGTDSSDKSLSKTREKRYQFTRGEGRKKENSWACIQRLAKDVEWRAFMFKGVLYFISEDDLFTQEPIATISEATKGVDYIDFDWNPNSTTKTHEATVFCHADLWLAPPGVVLTLEDCGPADGDWLVSTLHRGLFDPAAEITLKKPADPKPEPAPETTTVGGKSKGTVKGSKARINSDGTASAPADAPDYVAKMIEAGNHIHTKGYSYGGGHGSFNDKNFDCSAAVCYLLNAAGFMKGCITSGALESFGQAGRGRWFTVCCNSGHAYIEVAGIRMDTSRVGNKGGVKPAGRGPRWQNAIGVRSGFTARHRGV